MTDVAEFDGTRKPGAINDAVVLGSSDELGLVGRDFTVEAWVRVAPHDKTNHWDLCVLGTRWEGGTNTGLHLGLRNLQLHMGFFGNDTTGSVRTLREERWYHLAWRFAGATQTVFVNGLVEAFNGSRAPFAGTGLEVTLGQAHIPWHGSWDSFVGRISELRIWDHGVDERQIRERWTSRLGGEEPGLTSYWPLDDLDGGGAPRDRVRGTAGTIIGRTASVDDDTVPLYPPKRVEGIRFGAAAPSRFSLAWTRNLVPRDTPRFAVEAWVRPGNLDREEEPYEHPVVSQHGPSTGWELRAGNRAQFMVTVGREHVELSSAASLRRDVWQHLLGVYERSALSLYVNGVLDAVRRIDGDPVWYDGPLSIAHNPNFPARRFRGMLGDVRVWGAAHADPATLTGPSMWEGVASESPDHLVQFRFGTDAWLTTEVRASLLDEGLSLDTFPAPPVRRQNPGDTDIVTGHESSGDGERERAAPGKGDGPDGLLVRHETALQRIAELDLLVERLRLQIERLETSARERDDPAASDEDGDGTTLDAFVRDTRARIEKARREAADAAGSYRLGRVTVQARVLPGPRGTTIRFPDPRADGTPIDSGLLTTIELDFDSDAAGESAPALPMVPDVRGYTEPKARRELSGAGFSVEVSYQAVGNVEERDRVVDQRPVPASTREPGTPVTVFIGKQS